MSEWISFIDRVPPFDVRVEVKDEQGNRAIVFNQIYPPRLDLTEIVEVEGELENYKGLDFAPTHWRENRII